jgi:hypothetical protein
MPSGFLWLHQDNLSALQSNIQTVLLIWLCQECESDLPFMQILGHNPFAAGFFSGTDIQVIRICYQ